MSEVPVAIEKRRIARAAGLVSGLTLLSRLTGLLRDVVVSYYFGTGVAADAFFVAFRIPNLMRRLVGEGAMSIAFIPVFSDYLANRGREQTVVAARALATMMTVVLSGLTVAGVIAAPWIIWLFAPGFVTAPAKLELTIWLARVLFPYLFLISLVALLGGLLNALRHFAAPAMSPIFLNASIIACALVLCPHLAEPVHGLAYGVLIGGTLQLVVQLPPLLRRRIFLRPRWDPHHLAVRRVLWLMAPSLFGTAVYHLNALVNTLLASLLPEGSVSYLWYAERVFEFPVGLFAVALGTAALPSFATLAARGAQRDLCESVSFAIRLTIVIVIPATVGILCLAEPITAVLFQRGAFGALQVQQTARAVAAFSVGLAAVSIGRILVTAFYSLNDTRTPVVTAAVAFVVNAFGSLVLMGPVSQTGQSLLADAIAYLSQNLAVASFRHTGLVWAISLAATVNTALLFALLRRRLRELAVLPLAYSLLRSVVAASAMIWPVVWVSRLLDWTAAGDLPTRAGTLACAIAVGVAAYAVTMLLIGGPEVRRARELVREQLAGWR